MSNNGSDIQHNEAGMGWARDWLGPMPSLYAPELWRPASKIKVNHFQQIYLWPLVLQSIDPREPNTGLAAKRAVEATAASLRAPGSRWTEADDLLDHLPNTEGHDCEHSYAEFVYVHDFVQAVLFRKSGPGAPIRLYRRTDLAGVTIVLETGRFQFVVPRCNLYLFQNGTVILAVEFDSGAKPFVEPGPNGGERRPLSFADVQDVADKARRCYAPYFSGGAAQVVPRQVIWLDALDRPICGGGTPPGICEEFRRLRDIEAGKIRTAPVFQHWRELIAPLQLAGYEEENSRGPVWRQIVDERIPAMSFVSLTNAAEEHGHYRLPKKNPKQPDDKFWRMQDLRTVSRGDWIRLCYADGADYPPLGHPPAPLPYSPAFLENFEADACYDRHFPSEATCSATRFMFAGYHFAVVGAGEFFDGVLIHHFRRHYFQMALVLQMEFASLLAISSRISESVRDLHTALAGPRRKGLREEAVADPYTAFRKRIICIEEDFLETLHLFRLTGLSNQIQPREMFDKWRKAMDIGALFRDLKEELDAASQFLLSNEQLDRAEAANNLSTLAAIGVALGLAFSFLGMNVIVGDTMKKLLRLNDVAPTLGLWRELVPTGIVLAAAGLLGLCVFHRLMPNVDGRARRLIRAILWWTMGIGSALVALGTVFGWLIK